MHVLAPVEGALVVAALRQPQVPRVQALELRWDLGGLLFVLLLLLPHVVESLHEDGLVEELLPRPIVLEYTLDHPILRGILIILSEHPDFLVGHELLEGLRFILLDLHVQPALRPPLE